MGKTIVASLGAWMLLVSQSIAQTPGAAAVPLHSESAVPTDPLASHPEQGTGHPVEPSTLAGYAEGKFPEAPCFWVGADFLLWWIRNGPLPIALLTSTNDPAGIPSQGRPGTMVLFGGGSTRGLDFGTFPGGRITMGGWIDPDRLLGLEASGFVLQSQSLSFSAFSPGIGPPVIGIPFNLAAPFGLANPGEAVFVGNSFQVSAKSQLFGCEANFLYNLAQSDYFHWEMLIGFRSISLHESLSLSANVIDAPTNSSLLLTDRFATRNNFYGGQLGTRVGISVWRFLFESTFKVALGDMRNILNISGLSTVTGIANPFGVAPGTYLGGFFAEPSNIGNYHRDQFSVAPEFQLQISYALTSFMSCSVGGNAIYATGLLRPGNQIDRNIDLNQNAALGGSGAVGLAGPFAPLVPFKRSDFWAAGVNCGLEFHF